MQTYSHWPSGGRFYLSYPYSDAPELRTKQMKRIVDLIFGANRKSILIVPHYFWPEYEKYGRDVAMRHCLDMISCADAFVVCWPREAPLTNGMSEELRLATETGKRIIYLEDYLDKSLWYTTEEVCR